MSYTIPEEKEEYTIPLELSNADGANSEHRETTQNVQSNLRLPPPPLFSRQAIPQLFKLRIYRVTLVYFEVPDGFAVIRPTQHRYPPPTQMKRLGKKSRD